MGLPTKEQLQRRRERRAQRTSAPSMPSGQVVSAPSSNVPTGPQTLSQSPFGRFLKAPSQRYNVPTAPPDTGPGRFDIAGRDPLEWLHLATRGLGVGIGLGYGAIPGGPGRLFGKTIDVPWGEEGRQYRIPGATDLVPMIAAGTQAMQEGARLEEALSAAQDVVDAPPYYWGTAEAASAALPTGSLNVGGRALTAVAPQVGAAAARFAPQSIRPGTRQAVQTGLETAADYMRLPWQAEEFAGKYLLVKPVSWAFGKTIAATGGVAARLNSIFRNSGGRIIDDEAVAGAADQVARTQPNVNAGPGGSDPIALPQYTEDAIFSEYNLNIASNERIVTVVTTDAPQGQTWIVRDSVEVNKALADLQASSNVSIVDGVLNERQARDQWDRLYGAGSDAADRVIGPQLDPAGTPGIQPRVLSPEERLMTVQDVPTNVYGPRAEDPTAFQRVTAPVPEQEVAEAGQRISALQGRIAQLRTEITDLQKATGGSSKQKQNRARNLRNKQDNLRNARRELQELTDEAAYDPTRPFRLRVPEEQARFADEPPPRTPDDVPPPDDMPPPDTGTVDQYGNVQLADETVPFGDVRTLLGSPARLSLISRLTSGVSALLGRGYNLTTEISGEIQSAFRDREVVKLAMDSLTNRAKTIIAAYRRNPNFFRTNNAGQVLDSKLQNIRMPDGTVIKSPTIAQIAAHMDTYAPLLNDTQTEVMGFLRDTIEGGGIRVPGINKMWQDQDASFVKFLARQREAGLLDDGGFYIDMGKRERGRFANDGMQLEDIVELQMQHVRDIITDGYVISTVKRVGGIDPSRRTRGKSIDTQVDDLINDIADEDVMDELLRAIKSEVRGSERRNIRWISYLNDLYRGLKATADFSFAGIQGLVRFYAVAATAPYQTYRRVRTGKGDIDLVDWGKAIAISLKAMVKDAEALNTFFKDFDRVAAQEGTPTVAQLAAVSNVRVGAGATEFAIKGFQRLGAIGRGLDRVAARFNLAFGTAGDIMRLQFARKLFQAEMAVTKNFPQGRTFEDLVRSGKAREIGRTVNMMTGWTDNVAGSSIAGYDLANMAIFAPRFFQARLETIGQSLLGTARGVSGRDQTVMSREAAKAMWSMIGLGSVFTVAINESLQDTPKKETNYLQPFVNGYWNPNFMTIRIGEGETGREFNLFGPWMSILRLLISSGSAVKDRDPGELLSVYRGMTSGSMRVLWDNASGYTFMGDPAPFTQKDGARTIADPEHILNYIVETVTPIAAEDVLSEGRVVAENIPGALQGEPGAAAGIRAGVAGITGAMLGSNITELSRTDLKDEHAREKYNTPYQDLSRQAQKIVDFEIIAKHGERSFTGPQGALRKEAADAQSAHMEIVKATAEENLKGPIGVGTWNPAKARQEWRNSQRDMQRKLDEIYAKLYPDDDEKIPEEGTTEHLVYRYYKMFEENENPDGSLNYESLDEAEHDYWAGLTEAQRTAVLQNIRVLEGAYPPEVQDMRMASRYIGNMKMDIGGMKLSYWDLDKHPAVTRDLIQQVNVAPSKITQYLDASYMDRKGLTLGGESNIFKAIEKAHATQSREKGILHALRTTFIQKTLQDPLHKNWPFIMALWDYSFLKKENFEQAVISQSRTYDKAGKPLPFPDYEALYRSTLGGGPSQLVGTQ